MRIAKWVGGVVTVGLAIFGGWQLTQRVVDGYAALQFARELRGIYGSEPAAIENARLDAVFVRQARMRTQQQVSAPPAAPPAEAPPQ